MSNNESNVKEIDLYLVMKKGGGFLFKNKYILSSLFLIGIVSAFIRVKNNPQVFNDYYQSQFYIQSSFISDEIVFTLLKNLSFTYKKTQDEKFTKTIDNIKEIEPVKELSIDGLRSNIRVTIDIKRPQELDEILDLVKENIESTRYFKKRFEIKRKHYHRLLVLITDELDALHINVDDSDLASKLKGRTLDNPQKYLGYIGLIEKKQDLELKIANLDKSIEFVIVEPVNKLIEPTNRKVLLMLAYSFLLMIMGIVLIVIFNFFKK